TAKATVTASRTFSASNWSTPQTFTVTGVDEGTSSITHAATSSGDTLYNGETVASVKVDVTPRQTQRPPVPTPPPVFIPPPPPEPSMLVLTTNADDNTVGEDGGSVTVTATLNEAATSAVSVTLTATGSATADEDYTLPAAFTIAAGQTTATGTVQITDDETSEDSETVILTTTATGLTVTPVTLTITDNDTGTDPEDPDDTGTDDTDPEDTVDTDPDDTDTVDTDPDPDDTGTDDTDPDDTGTDTGTDDPGTDTGTDDPGTDDPDPVDPDDTDTGTDDPGTDDTVDTDPDDPADTDDTDTEDTDDGGEQPVEPAGFTDVDPGGTHSADIDALFALGITTGCNTDPLKFCPDNPVTRAQMASFLVRALKLPAADPAGFSDTDPGGTHSADIDALYAAGITTGCNTDPLEFCPDSPVTRAQMASFLVRALKLPAADPAGFSDVDPQSTHAADINALYAAGITTGCNTDPLEFCPDNPVTRAQMASFIIRALKQLEPA
nr:S-layer homology domain-containing protein [Acidimicrobiia bacterium]